MITLLAETPRDREMIEKFQRAYENLRKIVDRLQDENKKLREEFDEYRKRHPSTVGLKNSKPYAIREESAPPDGGTSRRKRGAQEGHKGHFREIPKITEHVRVKASAFTCPGCSSSMVRKGVRKRVIEDIPEVAPRVVQYRIERMYCRRCGRIFEPDIADAFPGSKVLHHGHANRRILQDRHENEPGECLCRNEGGLWPPDIRRRDTGDAVQALGFPRTGI